MKPDKITSRKAPGSTLPTSAISPSRNKVVETKGGIIEALPSDGLTLLSTANLTGMPERTGSRLIPYSLDALSASAPPDRSRRPGLTLLRGHISRRSGLFLIVTSVFVW